MKNTKPASREPLYPEQKQEQLEVLLTGDSEQSLDWLNAILAPVVEINSQRLLLQSEDTFTQLLQQQQPVDVIIHRLGQQPEQQLNALSSLLPVINNTAGKTTLIVIGPADQPLLMRAAMRAGASDYLPEPFSNQELLSLLETLFKHRQANSSIRHARVTAALSASGGAGATFLACNLAHIKATSHQKNLLLDLNFRMGSVLQFMDLYSDYGLEDVLTELPSLDQTALAGYLARHESGLEVLAMKQPDLMAYSDPDTDQLARLLKLLKQGRDDVVIDLPMFPTNISTFIQDQADDICLVIQQDMLSLRNALHWLDLSESELGLSRNQFTIVASDQRDQRRR
ncbi:MULTISPECIES: AAA family ATPase [unclassified Endozoicomonas]|uniref:AAA family ATPase n=1 Tax=unclassified Endozoicomonas TaxID=2644528 RepID=UPI003BB6A05B